MSNLILSNFVQSHCFECLLWVLLHDRKAVECVQWPLHWMVPVSLLCWFGWLLFLSSLPTSTVICSCNHSVYHLHAYLPSSFQLPVSALLCVEEAGFLELGANWVSAFWVRPWGRQQEKSTPLRRLRWDSGTFLQSKQTKHISVRVSGWLGH